MVELYNSDYGSFVNSDKGYCGFRNRLRNRAFVKLVNPQRNDKILEIGCNEGGLMGCLSRYSKNIYGIDINKENIKRLNNKRIRFMSATDLKFKNDHFNKVCAFEVIEHIPEIKNVFKEVRRVLKPNGLFIISFPLEIIRGQNALMDAIKVYKNPFYARKLHIHKLSPKRIKEITKDIPFKITGSSINLLPFPLYTMTLKKE